MKITDKKAATLAWTITMRHTQLGPAMDLINRDHANSEARKKECCKLLYGLISRSQSHEEVLLPDAAIKWLEE